MAAYPHEDARQPGPGGIRFLDSAAVGGTVPGMVTDTIQAAQRSLRKASLVIGAGREDYWEIEPEVIREAALPTVRLAGKPGAILLPYEVYERYEKLSRQHARLDSALVAAQSVQVELPCPFSPDHDREVAAYAAGEGSAAELYRRTAARYRQP